MEESIKSGISFGITSGTITTLGLMMGLYSSTGSKMVVIGGVLTIAIADALSDSLAMHVSEESRKGANKKNIWGATFSTFLAKFIYGLSFLIPLLIFGLREAIVVSVIYGLLVLSVLNYKLAKSNSGSVWRTISEHLIIAIIVLIATYYIGVFVGNVFG
jgi:vacuolar iron transporter family protein